MSKKNNNKEKVTDFGTLYKSYRKVKRGKKDRSAAIRFAASPLTELYGLKQSLLDGTYKMGKYTEFSVELPVHREVCSCAFKDKIVLRSLCKNVLWDTVEPHLIYDNYASRAGLGTHVALDRLEANLRSYYINHGSSGYVLKIDVRKYFYNLSHDLIKKSMADYGLDDWSQWLTGVILDSRCHSVKRGTKVEDGDKTFVVIDEARGKDRLRVGVPIGNETSQVFAVQYLNKIDHYIKDQRGLKYYGRYMDDSYIIHHDKAYLEDLLKTLTEMYGQLGLELNQKTQIVPLKNGISFLGMHFYLSDTGKVTRRLKPSNVKYQKVKIRKDAAKVAKGQMTEESFWRRRQSWEAHAAHADTKKLRKKMRRYAKEALRNAYCKEQRKLGDVREDVQEVPGTPD